MQVSESYAEVEEEDEFEAELEREIVEAVPADNGEAEEKADNDEDEADLGALTVVELKERLRSKGLPVSGRKAELIERLQQ